MSRSTVHRTGGAGRAAGRATAPALALMLALSACTDGTDTDVGGPTAEVETAQPSDQADETTSTSGTSGTAGTAADGDREAGSATGPDPAEEPDLETITNPEIVEEPAPEPSTDTRPDVLDGADVDAPQTDLGPSESVLCATVQIGFDAVSDEAGEQMTAQRAKLVDGAASVADADLRALLEQVDRRAPLDGDLLGRALSRCEVLGYRT